MRGICGTRSMPIFPVLVPTESPTAGDAHAAVEAVRAGCAITLWIGSPEGAVALTRALADAGLGSHDRPRL